MAFGEPNELKTSFTLIFNRIFRDKPAKIRSNLWFLFDYSFKLNSIKINQM